jgi:bifunctional non-homologous end joining protein LigD
MLATLTTPRDIEGYLFEIKWDGYRSIAMMNGKQIDLLSRNIKSFNEKFPPVFEAIKSWNIPAIVDGEIVALNEKGKPDFGRLQNWRSEANGELVYYVFDIMWWNGYDLTKLPLTDRRKILEQVLPSENNVIRLSETFDATATELLKVVSKAGMEGIMAKREDSIYSPGDRGHDWLKMKTGIRHEVVIGGYTQNEGTSKTFSALLVGVYKNGKLHYTGKVGTGFTMQSQKDLLRKMKPLVRKTSPFAEIVDYNKPSRFRPGPINATVQWLKPELVGEVAYTEMTSDGVMRHPSFKGLRQDKEADKVMEEKVWTPSTKSKSKK